MKNILKSFLLFLTFGAIFAQPNNDSSKTISFSMETVSGITYTWDSDFGEVISIINKTDSSYIYISEGDGFYYSQEFIQENNSIYAIQTIQRYDGFLFISESADVTYNKPLLRYPQILSLDTKWSWDGIEYFNEKGDTVNSYITGEVLKLDTLSTEVGSFETFVVQTKFSNDKGAENVITEWINDKNGVVQSKIEIEGEGLLGFIAGLLGYGEILFELIQIN